MEPFSCEGVFWLANTPDHYIPGRLEYKGHGSVDLTLFGLFDNRVSLSEPTDAPLLINGLAKGRKWSLYQPIFSKRNISFPGIDQETYKSALTVAGTEFFVDSDFNQLCGVDLQMDHLHAWIRRSGFHFELKTREGNSKQIRVEDIVHFLVKYKPLPDIYSSISNGTIKIKFPFTTDNKGEPHILSECLMRQDCSLGFEWNSIVDINEIINYSRYFRNLLTICIGFPPKISKIKIWKPNSYTSFDLYTSKLSNIIYNNAHIYSLQPGLNLDSFGSLKILSNWLKVSQKYDIAINASLSHKFIPDLYEENKFVNIIIAIEAIAKAQGSKDNIEHILKKIIKEVSSIFSSLVGDTEKWVNEFVIMRNDIIHSQRLDTLDYNNLSFLTKTSYLLIIIWLLQECQVLDRVVDDLQYLEDFRIFYKGISNKNEG